MKKVSAVFVIAWLTTALLLLIVPSVENAKFDYETLAEGLTVASLAGTLVLVVVAFLSLRSQTSTTVKMAISLAGMPICMAFLLWIIDTEPNVHGVSVVGLLINGFIGVLTALILLIVVGIRSFIRGNPDRQRRESDQVSDSL